MGGEAKRELNNLFIPLAPGGLGARPILLATKIHIPRPTHHLVARPRLIAQVQAALEHPVTLVCAPAGYGKTTLLADWAALCHCPRAWLSLDASDNDPTRFCTYFISALQTLKPGFGAQALGLLQLMGASQPESLLDLLLNELSELQEEWTLVLDDYHLITSEDVHRALTFLIDHLPEQIHLVLASRTQPPLPLPRLSARDQLIEIGKQDLSFTIPEVSQFFEQAGVFSLSPQDMDLLQSKTEGWITALRLVALSIQAQPDGSSYVAQLTGSHRRIASFLMMEVLRQQPFHVQEFLLRTSVLHRLCPSLCDTLLEDEDHRSREMLDYLEQTNLFLTAMDDEHRWYRYHHLLTDFLRDRLNNTRPDLVPGLYHRASLWYEQAGESAMAIETAITGQDWERAAHLIEVSYEGTVKRAEMTTLFGWIEKLPLEIVRSRPRLSLAKGWSLVVTPEHLEQGAAWLEEARRALHAVLAAGEEASETKSVLGEIAVLQGTVAIIRNEPEQVIPFSREALDLLPVENQYLRQLASIHLGIGYTATGDPRAARHHLTEGILIHDVMPSVMVEFNVWHHLAGVEILEGHLHAAAETFHKALTFAVLPEGTYLSLAMMSHIGLAGLLYEWNELESAYHHLHLGIELSQGWWRRDIVIEGLATLARIHHARGDLEAAFTAVQRADALFEDRYLPQSVAHVAAAQIRLWLQAGSLPAAARRADSLVETLNPDWAIHPEHHEKGLALARLLIAQDHVDAATAWLGPLLTSAERSGFTRRVVEALVLQALAYWGASNKRQALLALSRALGVAEPEQYIRVFVDEGAPMQAMLKETAQRGIAPDYTAKLLGVMGQVASTTPPGPAAFVERLSERELQILRLVAVGRTSQDTAEELAVSFDTVRFHLKNIFAKLQVHSRLQAVHRAKELKLL